MVNLLNAAAERLAGIARIHLVGLNKTCMYGGDEDCLLGPLVLDHGELPEEEIWDYVRNARFGLALATGPHAFDNDISKIFTYLRGGAPVLSEEPIVNNELIRRTGYGRVFRYGDIEDLVSAALELVDSRMDDKRKSVMELMVKEHSWETRVGTYVALFTEILGKRS